MEVTNENRESNDEDGMEDFSDNSNKGETVAIMFLGDVDIDVENADDEDMLENGENDAMDHENNNLNYDNINNNHVSRVGNTSSARFNILATMVGAGSLSLPLAFAKSGNALMGPVVLMLMAAISEYCFRIMVKSIRILSYRNVSLGDANLPLGRDSFESMAVAAFGPRAYVPSMALVTAMCFFAMVAYGVLLRDILEPITELIYGGPQAPGPSWRNNSLLWVVVLGVTPLCALRTLTSLKRFGAASMYSIFVLGCCILYRSLQCNLVESPTNPDWNRWTDSFRFWPERWWDVLDSFPLFFSCFVCHYNIPTVHNELLRPTVARVDWWLRSTTVVATLFYMFMGIAGSAYGAKCTATGHVQGNILLDFRNSDPLLSIGRTCLAITISIALPTLNLPARDIVLRVIDSYLTNRKAGRCNRSNQNNSSLARQRPPLNDAVAEDDITEPRATTSLREPLLITTSSSSTARHDNIGEQTPLRQGENEEECNYEPPTTAAAADAPLWMRLVVSMVLLYTATLVASVVDSIDTVWDLLGSSLSIFLSILIPVGSFLVITHRQQQQEQQEAATSQRETENEEEEVDATIIIEEEDTFNVDEQFFPGRSCLHRLVDTLCLRSNFSKLALFRLVARILIALFVPLMFISTGNAVYHTFFLEHG